MRKFIFIAFIFNASVLFSQADTIDVPYKEILTWPEEFSVHLDYGSGSITNSFADDVENLTVSNGPAFNVGLAWIHHYKGPALFRMELAIMNIQSKENMKAFSYFVNDSTEVKYSDGEVKKSVTYLTLPIMAGIELGRFNLTAGVQGGMRMAGKGYTKNQETYSKQIQTENVYADFNFGFRVGLGVRFAKNLYAEGSYYQGLGNVCSGAYDTAGQTWKISQLTFGIRYSFHYYKPNPNIDIFDIEELK